MPVASARAGDKHAGRPSRPARLSPAYDLPPRSSPHARAGLGSRHLAHPGAASWVRGRRGGSGCPWTGHGAPRATVGPLRAVPVNPLWLRVPRVTEVGPGFESPSLTRKPDRSRSHSPAHTKSRATSWDQFSCRVDPRNPTCWGHRLNPCEGSVTSDNNVADVG